MAVTEPVADYLLQAAGTDIMTPFPFQADIMNGVDPSAQDVALERNLFTQHKVRVFLYNQQVTDTLTQSFIALAQRNGIPSSASTRPCRSRVTTTSPGCWRKRAPSSRPWPARSQQRNCDAR